MTSVPLEPWGFGRTENAQSHDVPSQSHLPLRFWLWFRDSVAVEQGSGGPLGISRPLMPARAMRRRCFWELLILAYTLR